VTVVLNGPQIAIGGGNGGNGTAQIPQQALKRIPAKGRANTFRSSLPPDRPIHKKEVEKIMETKMTRPVTNDFSEVVSDGLSAPGVTKAENGWATAARENGRGPVALEAPQDAAE
jgi:hypothetical protein